MKIQENSKILLVCLGLDYDKTNIQRLDSKDLKNLFHGFGVIERVLIFSKKTILKAFLEFQSTSDAQNCRQFMHNCFFDNYGRVRLYFSNKKNVTRNSSFLDYYSLDLQNKTQEYQKQVLMQFKKNLPLLNTFQINLKDDQTLGSFVSFTQSTLPQSLNMESSSQKDLLQLQSSTIVVFNVPSFLKKIRYFYNYFSLFGDITKITYYKANFFKLRFKEKQFASYIISNRKKIQIEDMQICFQDKELLRFLKNTTSDQSVKSKKRIFRFELNFFQQKIIKQIFFPSQNLLVTFPKETKKIKQLYINQVIAFQIPKNYLELTNIDLRNTKNLILKYQTLQQAILIIAKFGTSFLNGKIFKITFFNNNISNQLIIASV